MDSRSSEISTAVVICSLEHFLEARSSFSFVRICEIFLILIEARGAKVCYWGNMSFSRKTQNGTPQSPELLPLITRSHLCETHAEEVASAITHGLGLALSILGLIVMIHISAGDPWRFAGAAIFGTTLVFLYLSSTIYHLSSEPKTKSVLQVIDHSAIYLLIAGSYTPISLVTLRGPWGWSLLGVVWSMAIAGVIIKSVMRNNREHWISTALYLVMGWLVVVAGAPLIRSMPPGGLVLLVAGGLCYTGGVTFFVWQKLKYNHAIWHLFVIAGSACHALASIFYIL